MGARTKGVHKVSGERETSRDSRPSKRCLAVVLICPFAIVWVDVFIDESESGVSRCIINVDWDEKELLNDC